MESPRRLCGRLSCLKPCSAVNYKGDQQGFWEPWISRNTASRDNLTQKGQDGRWDVYRWVNTAMQLGYVLSFKVGNNPKGKAAIASMVPEGHLCAGPGSHGIEPDDHSLILNISQNLSLLGARVLWNQWPLSSFLFLSFTMGISTPCLFHWSILEAHNLSDVSGL